MFDFPSPGSDHDLRFLYRPRDPTLYTSFERIGSTYKDTITWESDDGRYEAHGWDLPKYLRHMATSNASVAEWSKASVAYVDCADPRSSTTFRQATRAHVNSFHSIPKLISSYRGMALSREYKECGTVKKALHFVWLLMTLDVLRTNRLPEDVRIGALGTDARWNEEEMEMVRRLIAVKETAAGGSQSPDPDILEMLAEKLDRLREDGGKPVEEKKDDPDTRAKALASLPSIWFTYSGVRAACPQGT
ncbi:hypothetical protein HKX48_009068 [Thoreauomyces humboldtii]|nr:hypothetical protein HKX48_009068 [Thoreauomyces humboldtii]